MRSIRAGNVSAELRIKVTQAAAPYVHAKPGTVRSGELAPTAKLIEGARMRGCGDRADFVSGPTRNNG
jgi:hypothetical protein